MSFPMTLTRDQVDSRLTALTAAVDAMSTSLLDLENHPGHQLLRSYPQTGETAAKWAIAVDSIGRLWADLQQFRAVVDSAKEIRSRRSRPDPAELAELSYLLTGQPIDLGGSPVPFSERSLTGPAITPNRIGLDGLADRMNRAFEQVGDLVSRVDTIATTVREQLAPIETALAAARKIAEEAGPGDPDTAALHRLEDRILDLTRASVSDALSLANPGRDTAALAATLQTVLDRQRQLADLRASWPQSLQQLQELVGQISAAEQRAEQFREQLQRTIRTGPVPAPADRSTGVGNLVAALSSIVGWSARAVALATARRATRAALDAALADEQLVSGPLQRRTELKGRLSAYRSKATRLGLAGDPVVAAQYERAGRALAAVPCDLAVATTEVAGYQQLLRDLDNRTPGRTA